MSLQLNVRSVLNEVPRGRWEFVNTPLTLEVALGGLLIRQPSLVSNIDRYSSYRNVTAHL